MQPISHRRSEALYALFRFVTAMLYFCHGADKLFGLFSGHPLTHVPLMLAAGIVEFTAGLMIAFGLFTEWAAFVASGEMAAAYFIGHAPHGFWPYLNHGEMAVFYCFAFLYIASRGTGRYGLTRTRR